MITTHRSRIRTRLLPPAILLALTAALCTTATAAGQSEPSVAPAEGARSTMSSLNRADREFIIRAAKLGVEEVRLSQLATANATNADVKAFAQKIIDDHQKLNKELADLAQRKGLMLALDESAIGTGARMASPAGSAAATTPSRSTETPSSETRTAMRGTSEEAKEIAEHRVEVEEKVRELAEKRGAEFDRAYLEPMLEGHENTIEIFESAVDRNSDPEITAFANKHLTTLRQHEATAKQLERQLKG